MDVTVQGGDWSAPIGLFGRFRSVTIVYPEALDAAAAVEVWGQDLAGDTPVNITAEVSIDGNRMTVPGTVIDRVGLMCASEGDLSGPGMVMKVSVARRR